MTLESKENYPRHTKIVQNSLGFMPEVKPLHKPRGDLVLCALSFAHILYTESQRRDFNFRLQSTFSQRPSV